MLEAQQPAEGILQMGAYWEGDTSRMFKAVCECGDDDHSHVIDIEADECGVNVIVYTTQSTKFWEGLIKERYDIESYFLQKCYWKLTAVINGLYHRTKMTWDLWVKGRLTYEVSICMTAQQSANYATALANAAKEVLENRKKR